MAEHSEPTPSHDPNNSRPEIPPPLIPHRRWLLDGQQLSLCCEKARPFSQDKHSHPEAHIWLFFESASGVFTSWNAEDACREVRLMGRQVFCAGPHVPRALHWETETSLIEAHFRPTFFANIPADQAAAVLARESLEGAAHDRVLWELASTIRLLCSQPEQPEIRLLEPMMAAIARRVFAFHGDRYAPKLGTRLSEDRTQRNG